MAVKKTQMYRRNLDGTETNLNPLTESQYVLMENGQTVQEVLSDRDSDKYTPVITNSSSTFKVGQGDNVDLSSSMKEGAYDSCVLKGKTMVNCIQEPSSKDVVLPYEFEDGHYVTINDTKESGALGVELKGQTLVNLVGEKREYSSAGLYGWEFMLPYKLIQNEKYMVIFNASGTITSNSKVYLMDNGFGNNSGNTPYPVSFTLGYNKHITTASGANHKVLRIRTDSQAVNDLKVSDVMLIPYQEGMENWDIPYFEGMTSCKMPILSTTGKNLFDTTTQKLGSYWSSTNTYNTRDGSYISDTYVKVTTGQKLRANNTSGSVQYMEFDSNKNFIQRVNVSPNNTYTVPNNVSYLRFSFYDCGEGHQCQVEEGTSSTTYEAHKSSILSCNILDYHEDKILLNKNLSPDGVAISNFNGRAIVYQVPAKGGTVYHTSTIANNVKESWYAEYDSNKNVITTRTRYTDTFTTKANTAYVSFFYVTGLESNALNSKAQVGYMLYEDEVILRSLPNGVRDTFNTRTGVYTQKTMEVVFNGEEDWSPINITHESLVNDYVAFGTAPTHMGAATQINGKNIIDTHGFSKLVIDYANNGSYVGEAIIYHNNGKLYIRVLKTRLSTQDVNGWKQWLSKSPVTVQYELKTPIVTKINLPSTLKSWNTATHIYSEIPESTLYPILTHSNPSYPVILKPSTKYSIVANSYSNSHTNSAINFNLGGATASTTVGSRVTTVTTPSTLSNELLTMSGRGNKLNNVMVIEGDVVGDEPYFEGICDCQSPILSNVGKNLFDVDYFVKKVNNPNVCYKNEEGSLVIKGSYHSVKINIPYPTTLTYLQTSTNTANNGASIFEAQHPDGTCTHIGVGVNTTLERKTWSIKKPIIAIGFNNWAGGENILKDIMLVKTEDSTAYEPYKSNTTTFEQKDGKTIVLRSLPNGVCDTLNVETGEYVQRIGEIVLNGSEEGWTRDSSSLENSATNKFYISNYFKNAGFVSGVVDKSNLVCHKLSPVDMNTMQNSATMIYCIANSVAGSLNIRCPKSADSTNALKTWLRANPINVHCELTKPIVSTIDVQGFPYAYTNGHVQLSSGSIEQSLTPTVEYSLSANKTGQIQSNTKRVSAHQKQLDDFEAMMLTQMVQSAYDKAILQFDYEMQMMSLGGE